MRLVRLVAAAMAIGLACCQAGPSSVSTGLQGQTLSNPVERAYYGLRSMAFARTAPPGIALPDYGILLDMGMDGQVATLAAYGDGTVSLYFSKGGGVLGSGSDKAIGDVARQLTTKLATDADDWRSRHVFEPVAEYPVPKDGEAFFYLRTPKDILKAARPIDQLEAGQDELSPLWNTMQQLLAIILTKDGQAGGKKG